MKGARLREMVRDGARVVRLLRIVCNYTGWFNYGWCLMLNCAEWRWMLLIVNGWCGMVRNSLT